METNEHTTLKIDPSTATQLMAFARKWKTPYANSIRLMLDFFKRNGLSPTEDLRPNMKSIESRLGQRIDSLTAILRNIERTQTRPTHDLTQQLLQVLPASKKKILVERKLLQNKEFSPGEMTHKQSRGLVNKLDPGALETLKGIFKNGEAYPNGTGGQHLHLNLSHTEVQQLQEILKSNEHGY